MDYLDFNGLQVYDEQIKTYINTVSGSGIKIIPMNTAPTSSTLTYTVEGVTYNFNVGDEVVVRDTTEGTEETNYYVVYKLYSIENNTAYWDLAGQGGGSVDQLMETVNVTLNGGAFTSELSNVVVTATVDGVATEYTGTNIQFKVPFGVHYSVSAASASEFDAPTGAVSDVTAVAGNTRNVTFTYSYKTVDLTVGTNQSDMTDLENTNISIADKQFTLNQPTATSQSFSTHVATGTSVVFTFGSVTGYKSPVIADTIANDNIDLSVSYQTEILTISSVTVDEGDIIGTVFTVNGVAKTYGTDTLTWKVPFGESDAITHNIDGYNVTITKTPNTDVADSATKTAVVSCEITKNGVFAYYSDGSIRSYADADSNAIGVAVIQDDISFIIDKVDGGTKAFGGYNKDLTSTGIVITTDANVAKQDFDGYNNTTKIINACTGYTAENITGAPAAEYCRTRFNGKGYLPSLGEMNIAYQYKTDIDSMMSKIGSTTFPAGYLWCSTLYNASVSSWILGWHTSVATGTGRIGNDYVRAFCAFTTTFSLTLQPLDSSPVANVSLSIIDSHNEIHLVTTDSEGKVTVEVPYGDIHIRSNKYRLSTSTITGVNSTNNTATIQISAFNTGIFAYYSDGTMQTYENATTSAIGVAVITNNCAFVIDKAATNSNNTIQYGGYNKDLSSTAVTNSTAATAKLDFDGENNTDRIINACIGYTDSTYSITGAPAAEACRAAFNGKGYLGSLGEWQEAYNNKSYINNMMTKIGGTAIVENYHWTSTHYNALSHSWRLYWGNGYTTNYNRCNDYCVRAFRALSL